MGTSPATCGMDSSDSGCEGAHAYWHAPLDARLEKTGCCLALYHRPSGQPAALTRRQKGDAQGDRGPLCLLVCPLTLFASALRGALQGAQNTCALKDNQCTTTFHGWQCPWQEILDASAVMSAEDKILVSIAVRYTQSARGAASRYAAAIKANTLASELSAPLCFPAGIPYRNVLSRKEVTAKAQEVASAAATALQTDGRPGGRCTWQLFFFTQATS